MDDFSHNHVGTMVNFRAAAGKKPSQAGLRTWPIESIPRKWFVAESRSLMTALLVKATTISDLKTTGMHRNSTNSCAVRSGTSFRRNSERRRTTRANTAFPQIRSYLLPIC
jgi:hypothetical protein